MDAVEQERRHAKALLRARIAAETIELCARLERRPYDPGLALEWHDTHARHCRELGRLDLAERAEERFDRELQRSLHGVVRHATRG